MGAVEEYRKEKKRLQATTMEDAVRTHFYVNPISIDFDAVDRASRKPEVLRRKKEILAPNLAQDLSRDINIKYEMLYN